ncbi:MAG: hypothetical protein AB8B89_06425 [Gammaproteobacteria bacterium]
MLELGLFWIGAVLIVTAIFMLFLDSFQSRRIWAVISLLLILPLFIHMLFHWSSLNIRKSLYILIIGLIAVLVSISGGALSKLPFLQKHEVVQVLEDKIAPPEDTPLSNQQQADTAAELVEDNYDPLLTGSEYEQLETKEIVPEKINKVVRKAAPAARYELIQTNERIHAVNKRVRVTMLDGSIVEGQLTDIVGDSLVVETEVGGGSLGLSYKNEQIQSVAVRLVEGEELYVPEEPETVSDNEPKTGQQSSVVDEAEARLKDDAQSTQDVGEGHIHDGAIEVAPDDTVQKPVSEASETLLQAVPEQPAIEDEVLEKVEEIVDDTKLLDKVNGS